MESRLTGLMHEHGLKTYNELADRIDKFGDKEILNKVTDCITTRETRFFRDETVFDAFFKYIMPAIMENKPAKIRILSMGCSTGQEPYSIAMGIMEYFSQERNNIHILATDISNEALLKAKQGIYSKFELNRGISDYHLNKYFDEKKQKFEIKSYLKSMIQFEKQNCIKFNYGGPYHIIFFRNVSIYFSEDMRVKIFQEIYNSLLMDGIIVLGTAETLINYFKNIKILEYGTARFYRK